MAHQTTSTELAAAIENLYAVFARYKLRGPVRGCPCCVSDEMTATIASGPLRELTHASLQDYSTQAMTTWGDVDHFRHFLPRLCELMCLPVSDARYALEFDFLCMKLDDGRWKEWPANERAAITRFFLALWHEVVIYDRAESTGIIDSTGFWDTMDMYHSLFYFRPDVAPFLEACVRSSTPSSVRFLKELALECATFNRRQMVTATQTSYWDGVRADVPGLLEVMLSPTTAERLEAEFFDEHSSLDKTELSAAIDAIERLRVLVTSAA